MCVRPPYSPPEASFTNPTHPRIPVWAGTRRRKAAKQRLPPLGEVRQQRTETKLMIQNKTIMAEKVQINADKLKVLDAVMQKIEKDFGKGSIMRMNTHRGERHSGHPDGFDSRSTWRWAWAAIPRAASWRSTARVVGQDHAGDSRHRRGAEGRAASSAFIDAEHALDPVLRHRNWAWTSTNLLISAARQRRAGARNLPTRWCVRAPSTSSSSTRWRRWCPRPRSKAKWATSNDGPAGAPDVAGAAQAGGRASRRPTTIVHLHQPAAREDRRHVYGNPETTTGGNALKFYASVRIDIRRMRVHQEGRRGSVGQHARRSRSSKNKVAPPFKQCGVRHHVTARASREIGEIVDLARRATAWSRRAARGTPTATARSARDATP